MVEKTKTRVVFKMGKEGDRNPRLVCIAYMIDLDAGDGDKWVSAYALDFDQSPYSSAMSSTSLKLCLQYGMASESQYAKTKAVLEAKGYELEVMHDDEWAKTPRGHISPMQAFIKTITRKLEE